MKTNDNNIDAIDITTSRIAEAKAITTILAMATNPMEGCGPSGELVSRALDGVTALLDQAHTAAVTIACRGELRAA